MSNKEKSALTRRKFLAEVGASAVAIASVRNLNASNITANSSASSLGPRAPERVVNVGVVGGGFGSQFQWHLDPNCKVVALCDLRADRLKDLTTAYGRAQTYKTFRDFLKHPQLEAVAVFTPAPLHVWMATEAMKSGKHVISAAP